MVGSLNKVMLIGNLGKDPEVRTIPAGKMVANFSLACSESWRDQGTGEKRERTEWVNCVAWGKLAEIIQKYVHKGSRIYVEGRFTTRSWEDKNGGGKRYASEIDVAEMIMLDGRPGGGEGGGYEGGAPAARPAYGGGAARGPARSSGMGAASGPEDFGDYSPAAPSAAAADDDLPF